MTQSTNTQELVTKLKLHFERWQIGTCDDAEIAQEAVMEMVPDVIDALTIQPQAEAQPLIKDLANLLEAKIAAYEKATAALTPAQPAADVRERVARAICEADDYDPDDIVPHVHEDRPKWRDYEAHADATLSATPAVSGWRDTLNNIDKALDKYHTDLLKRENGDIAASRLVSAVEHAFGRNDFHKQRDRLLPPQNEGG